MENEDFKTRLLQELDRQVYTFVGVPEHAGDDDRFVFNDWNGGFDHAADGAGGPRQDLLGNTIEACHIDDARHRGDRFGAVVPGNNGGKIDPRKLCHFVTGDVRADLRFTRCADVDDQRLVAAFVDLLGDESVFVSLGIHGAENRDFHMPVSCWWRLHARRPMAMSTCSIVDSAIVLVEMR